LRFDRTFGQPPDTASMNLVPDEILEAVPPVRMRLWGWVCRPDLSLVGYEKHRDEYAISVFDIARPGSPSALR